MGTKNQHLYTFPPHQLAPKGLIAKLVEHYTGDVSVWVRSPLKSWDFLCSERKSWDEQRKSQDLNTSATVMYINRIVIYLPYSFPYNYIQVLINCTRIITWGVVHNKICTRTSSMVRRLIHNDRVIGKILDKIYYCPSCQLKEDLYLHFVLSCFHFHPHVYVNWSIIAPLYD